MLQVYIYGKFSVNVANWMWNSYAIEAVTIHASIPRDLYQLI